MYETNVNVAETTTTISSYREIISLLHLQLNQTGKLQNNAFVNLAASILYLLFLLFHVPQYHCQVPRTFLHADNNRSLTALKTAAQSMQREIISGEW